MRFLCNNCDAKISTKYCWEGLSITCPACGKPTELRHRRDEGTSGIAYSITFSDFKQLLSREPYFTKVDPVVKEFLKCSIERTETGVKLIEEDGSLIPLEVAHLEIQFNPNFQRSIYNIAMSLWR